MPISFSTAAHAQVQNPFIDEKKPAKPICVAAFGDTELAESSGEEFRNVNARIVDHQGVSLHPKESAASAIHQGGYLAIEFYLEEHHLTDDLGLYITHWSFENAEHKGNCDGAFRMKLNGRTFYENRKPRSKEWISDERIDLSSLVDDRVLHPGINTLHLQLDATAWPYSLVHKIVIAKS